MPWSIPHQGQSQDTGLWGPSDSHKVVLGSYPVGPLLNLLLQPRTTGILGQQLSSVSISALGTLTASTDKTTSPRAIALTPLDGFKS